jgi:hypothetical protein
MSDKRYPTRMHEVLRMFLAENLETLEWYIRNEMGGQERITCFNALEDIVGKLNLAMDDLRKDCTTCLHKGKSGLSAPCLGCQGANYANWKWRGLCAENRRKEK